MSLQASAILPEHPGCYVRRRLIDELGLSVTDAAQALRVTRPALSKFLNERTSLSSEMAVRMEKAFGIPIDTLMKMQNAFDISQARKRAQEIDVLPFSFQLTRKQHSSAAFKGTV